MRQRRDFYTARQMVYVFSKYHLLSLSISLSLLLAHCISDVKWLSVCIQLGAQCFSLSRSLCTVSKGVPLSPVARRFIYYERGREREREMSQRESLLHCKRKFYRARIINRERESFKLSLSLSLFSSL